MLRVLPSSPLLVRLRCRRLEEEQVEGSAAAAAAAAGGVGGKEQNLCHCLAQAQVAEAASV